MDTPDQRTRLGNLLTRAPALLRELDVTIVKLDEQGATGGASGEKALVYNVHASECKDELRRAVAHAAKRSLAGGREARVTYSRNTDLDAEAARIALDGLNDLLKLADADAIEEALRLATARALNAIDRAEERITYGPCQCGVELSAPASRDVATCSSCGRKWDLAELKAFRYVAAQDRAADAVGTVGQLVDVARGLGHKAGRHTLNNIVRRKAIEPVGTRATRNLYRYGDLAPHL